MIKLKVNKRTSSLLAIPKCRCFGFCGMKSI